MGLNPYVKPDLDQDSGRNPSRTHTQTRTRQVLLDYGADPSICIEQPRDSSLAGMTAYDIAVKVGALQMAALLSSATLEEKG